MFQERADNQSGSQSPSHQSGRSWWLTDVSAGRHPACQPLTDDATADVCVVGGGWAGLWAAIHLKLGDRSLVVKVIERDHCGSGASGRNAGYAMGSWSKFSVLEAGIGTAAAADFCDRSSRALQEMLAFIVEHGIDAGVVESGWLWAATNSAQVVGLESVRRQLSRHAAPFLTVSAGEVRERTGSDTFYGGLFDPTTVLLQPAALSIGLRDVALKLGVGIHEGTPMTALDRSAPMKVRTPNGEITAAVVVVATNGWATGLNELRNKLMVLSTDAIVTAPIGDVQFPPMQSNVGVTDSGRMVNAFRGTSDGRVFMSRGGGNLLFGHHLGDRYDDGTPQRDELKRQMDRIYPQLRAVGVSQAWRGPVDLPINGAPIFAPLDTPGLFASVGFGGVGLTQSFMGGQVIAAQVLGTEDDLLTSPVTKLPRRSFPPEPLRHLGGRVVHRAIRRKQELEDREKSPSKAVKLVAGMDPTGSFLSSKALRAPSK
jgi:glycine/D-amino acid oxidase-like deaminating enzyme